MWASGLDVDIGEPGLQGHNRKLHAECDQQRRVREHLEGHRATLATSSVDSICGLKTSGHPDSKPVSHLVAHRPWWNC